MQQFMLVLRGSWTSTSLNTDNIINVVWDPSFKNSGTFFAAGGGLSGASAVGGDTIVVDGENHWLIVHPYQLLSPSMVGDASKCLRDGAIRSKHNDTVSVRVATLGNLKHDLFERSMLSKYQTLM